MLGLWKALTVDSNDRLKSVPVIAFTVLRFEFGSGDNLVNTTELATDRAKSMPWHLMPKVVGSLRDVSRFFQRFHLRFLTNGSAFFPEMTPFSTVFSASFFAFAISNSNTEIPTNDIYAASSK